MSNILHILSNDKKFFPYIVNTFAGTTSNNRFVVLVDSNESSIIDPNVEFVILFSDEYLNFAKDLNVYDIIFIHGFSKPLPEVLFKVKAKIVWVFWGLDGYALLPGFELYDEETKKLVPLINNVERIKRIFTFIFGKDSIISIYRRLSRDRKITINSKVGLINCLERIDYCATHIREDYEVFQSANKSFKAHWGWLTYYSIKNILPDKIEMSGSNIIIGNSATLTGNHLDVFELLKCCPIEDRKIIVPLSYGNKVYSRIVKYKGKRFFGNNFYAISKFLSLSEYNDILSSCSIAIMNHRRQQSMGNIIALIYMGCRVYMNEESPGYKYFKRIKLHIFSVNQDLSPKNPKVLDPLESSCVDENRRILEEEYGENVVINRLNEFLYQLRNDK